MTNLINISKEMTCSVQVNYCDFEVSTKSTEKVEIVNITGIIIKPNWIEVKPTYFRSQIIKRENLKLQENEKISEDLLNGIYYLNFKDYTEQELRIASDFLTDEWVNSIWLKLTSKNNDITVILKNEIVLEHLLKKNSELVKTKFEFEEFCQEKGLKISDFIVSGNFLSLENKLQEISIRLEMEQFFARRFLFTETLIKKLNSRLSSYSKNSTLEKENSTELKNWITDLRKNNSSYKEYKNFQQIYEMPKQNIKINKSKNVTFVNGDIKESKLQTEYSKPKNKNSKLKLIATFLVIVVAIMEIIIYWDEIIKIFN